MKKILFIHHANGVGGAFINMHNIVRALDKTQYLPMVLLIKESKAKELLEKDGIKTFVCKEGFYRKRYKYFSHIIPGMIRWNAPFLLLHRSICWFLSRNFYAEKELEGLAPDIIHLNSSVLTDWLKPSQKKAKTIIHIQEPIANGYFGIRKKIFVEQIRKYSDHIIAISKDNSKRIGIPEKTSVVYNFFNVTRSNNEPYIANKSLNKKALYLGGDEKIKGFFTMVDALEYIDDNIEVVFAGNYRFYSKPQKMKELIRCILPRHIKRKKAFTKMQNSTKSFVVGFLEDVSYAMKEATVIVSPFEAEHFSRPLIEAFFYKKAVIGTNVDGMDEIIENNINGKIVEKGKPRQLAEAINFLIKNSDISEKMGCAGFRKAQKLYSSKNIHIIENIYRGL